MQFNIVTQQNRIPTNFIHFYNVKRKINFDFEIKMANMKEEKNDGLNTAHSGFNSERKTILYD
jgi:hypothetical protein